MLGPLLITFREGLEAALVIAIVFAYLARTNNRGFFRYAWYGTALGILVSLIAGAAIFVTAGELKDPAEAIFEGATLFLATGVLTWMIFWMRQQASSMRSELQREVQAALSNGSSFGLVGMAFIAVAREGIELALFLFAATRAQSPLLSAVGGTIGLALAVTVGYALYRGTARLNLRLFFNATSLLLIVFAAGLFAIAVHEFNETGLLPPIVEHVWDSSRIVAPDSVSGQFLNALFGYDASPSLAQVIAYILYLVLTLTAFLYTARRVKRSG